MASAAQTVGAVSSFNYLATRSNIRNTTGVMKSVSICDTASPPTPARF